VGELLASRAAGSGGRPEVGHYGAEGRARKLAEDEGFIGEDGGIATAEKDGFFTGRYAVNPFNGEKVPFGGEFCAAGVWTGAIMAVPAHDERDNEFASKFGLPIPVVVSKERVLNTEGTEEEHRGHGDSKPAQPFTEYGYSMNSGSIRG